MESSDISPNDIAEVISKDIDVSPQATDLQVTQTMMKEYTLIKKNEAKKKNEVKKKKNEVERKKNEIKKKKNEVKKRKNEAEKKIEKKKMHYSCIQSRVYSCPIYC